MRSEDLYQITLISLGVIATIFFGVFFYREIFPEYKIYQQDFVALESFRSSYTGQPSAPFSIGIKQIVLEREDRGPPTIDRCTSCHVALDVPYFSPTKIAHDINGKIIVDMQGFPVKVPNEEYIWKNLDDKIAALTDEKVNAQLKENGESSTLNERMAEAEHLKSLKTAHVGEYVYDVSKVLTMHPLMGKETRPFEFHPVEEYGCVVCHNGNGRGLTTEKAHGPVFDGQYGVEHEGYHPSFSEVDPENDPLFSRIFNHKPDYTLTFQTTPIYVGPLIQANCMNCHRQSETLVQDSIQSAQDIAKGRENAFNTLQASFLNEEKAVLALITLRRNIVSKGLLASMEDLKAQSDNHELPIDDLKAINNQLQYLISKTNSGKQQLSKDQIEKAQISILQALDDQMIKFLGSSKLADQLEGQIQPLLAKNISLESAIDKFIAEHKADSDATGTLFVKAERLSFEKDVIQHVHDTTLTFKQTLEDQKFMSSVHSDIDILTKEYLQGQELFISQACYACHRIAGFSRGGTGPDLTREGLAYPWFIKQKIVWPQGDLKTSTMPNMHLDHEEIQDVMAYLLAQKGENKSLGDTAYKLKMQEWDAGRKMPWETAASPVQVHDLNYSMTVFATEGCAACHRLQGFKSDVGFAVEKNEKLDYDGLDKEKQWFVSLFPEGIVGSEIVNAINEHSDEIDKHIIDNVRKDSILEQIELNHPNIIEGYYSNFKYAFRAKNHEYQTKADNETDPVKKQAWLDRLDLWKKQVHRILMMFIQEYGLGRIIGPRPNWAGVYRSDEWLMEHFHNPSSHVPRSIMPIFPFDDTKFMALTYMLDLLGIRNRDAVKQIWRHNGFDPALAAHILCSQCHGEFLLGNGPVSAWIYPIPKNLRSASFLRNLTRERVIQSITHGVNGTPMPPWGEVANKSIGDAEPVLSKDEIQQLANWLFSFLPGGEVIHGAEDVPKWKYTPEDFLQELHREGEYKGPVPISEVFDVKKSPVAGPDKQGYYLKKKFYTQENIEQGRQFFEINCSVCHGREADGSGVRAAFMQDAKPRMLINLDWLNSRDDLRLLRSIKYGVPGTAMTPWGDFSTAYQRLQLVAFIRSLSIENEKKVELSTLLYKIYDEPQFLIEKVRNKEFSSLEDLQKKYQEVRRAQVATSNRVQEGDNTLGEALKLYQQQLLLSAKVKEKEAIDNLYLQLQDLLYQERTLYYSIGTQLIVKNMDDDILSLFYKIIDLNGNRYHLDPSDLLILTDQTANQNEQKMLAEKLVQMIDAYIGKPQSDASIVNGYVTLKNLFISQFAQAQRLQNQQYEIVQRLQK